MGIKGVYKELGPGQRVALSKLAADSFVNSNRPFRIAIDIAIWQFQNQAARGGTNPAIRTLFYRLTRLLGTPVEPVFVFDGPKKPAFKRNKRSGRGDALASAQAKRLIKLFGFVIHDAPGEAEAECALLQRQGIVDAVLSEDVDTIMFGCTKMLRNWSAEGKGSTPTHVSLYDSEDMSIKELGLGREGMVLIALMSGGDYLPDGIPGCGVKVACEAAKAGFGKSICRLKASDKAGIQSWRESLVHELETNEKGYFRTKHKALTIPEDFPNLEVLRYYTHPVVSPQSIIDGVREKLKEKREMHLEALREFTRETFGWDFRIGAIKFIRVLGQARLVSHILEQNNEGDYVKRISCRRAHFSTDATQELRLSYIPQDLVPIDLSKEVEEEISSSRDGLALNSDDEYEGGGEEAGSKVTGKIYDPSKPDLAWVLEAVAKHSVPAMVEEFEATESAKASKTAKATAAKTTRKAPAKKITNSKVKDATMPIGALDQFVTVKKVVPAGKTSSKSNKKSTPVSSPQKSPNRSPPTRISTPRRLRIPSPLESSKQPTASTTLSPVKSKTSWTLASSPTTPRTRRAPNHQQAIVISSSPVSPADSPPPSPSPRPRAAPTASQELPESVRSILSARAPAEVRDRVRRPTAKTSQKAPSFNLSQPTKTKQASIDMFTNRISKPSTYQPKTKQTAQPKVTPPPIDDFDDSDSDSELEPLSSLLARASVSPSKRQSDVISASRSMSPSLAAPARKKKLFIPQAEATGYAREVDVGAENINNNTTSSPRDDSFGDDTQPSDIIYIDLTQDD